MLNLTLFIATSLDNYIASPDGSVDWLFTDQDYNYTSFYKNIHTLLLGRKTYDQILTFGPYPYPTKQSIVFTHHTPDHNPHPDNITFADKSIIDYIHHLKSQHSINPTHLPEPEPQLNLWLVGGASLIHPLIHHNLIDTYIFSVHPVLLGKGVPLFPHSDNNPLLHLNHTKTESFPTGLVQSTYIKA
ncbi:dihydrofolate reductase family protein [Poriferisphaera sp. WC338]|uniref:dihydrofolate reductase family protein n=1 Tax=Poriferisphaera sp. WC338 TaxID=3425129 RepID=UPI003D815214